MIYPLVIKKGLLRKILYLLLFNMAFRGKLPQKLLFYICCISFSGTVRCNLSGST